MTCANSWNYDPNRLQVLHRQQVYNKSNHNYRYSPQINARNLPSTPRQRFTGIEDPSSPYSHYKPVIITAPKLKTYKSVEDPSDFYRNTTKYGIFVRRFKPGVNMNPTPIDNTKYKPLGTLDNRRRPSYTGRMHLTDQPRVTRVRYPYHNSVDNRYSDLNDSRRGEAEVCVRCPDERTVIASKGRERVVLEMPDLFDCNGNPSSITTSFNRLFGPKIGTLLKEGSHITVGEIMHGNQPIQKCQYRYNVIVRRCSDIKLPSNVEATCLRKNAWGTTCRFRCTLNDPPYNMKGPYRAKCMDDLLWSTAPPTCEPQERFSNTWCNIPIVPKRALLECETADDEASETRFPEGSECKFSCSDQSTNDFSNNSESHTIVCKYGVWHGQIPICRNTRRRRHKLQKRITVKGVI